MILKTNHFVTAAETDFDVSLKELQHVEFYHTRGQSHLSTTEIHMMSYVFTQFYLQFDMDDRLRSPEQVNANMLLKGITR